VGAPAASVSLCCGRVAGRYRLGVAELLLLPQPRDIDAVADLNRRRCGQHQRDTGAASGAWYLPWFPLGRQGRDTVGRERTLPTPQPTASAGLCSAMIGVTCRRYAWVRRQRRRVHSSVVEHSLFKAGVAGSKSAAPTVLRSARPGQNFLRDSIQAPGDRTPKLRDPKTSFAFKRPLIEVTALCRSECRQLCRLVFLAASRRVCQSI
jgi:hypothetical protein